MKFAALPVSAFVLLAALVTAQSLPIIIDSRFDDWTAQAIEFEDAVGDGTNIDLLRFAVANDENYLFIRLEMAADVVLTESNALTLFLDTDNNPLTGKILNGIGAELELRFGDREGRFYLGNFTYEIGFSQVGFRHQPTVSSQVFEMAIARDATPVGNNPLFPGNTLRILFRDGNGDQMPNAGLTFSYQFDNTPTPPLELVSLQKENPQSIRLLTWNTLHDGLDDNSRKVHFQRVLNVLQPDIVTFNECWDMTAGQVASFMNLAVPLGNFQSWQAVKLDAGNVTASRFPILQSWYFYPGYRLTASLIDLPDNLYPKDLLVVNGHLRCCSGGNYFRQLEADAFAAFIRDAKTPGGTVDLPEGTPFVLSGDLNLVGSRQQLTTLLTGQIVNTAIFGTGGPLDWDGSDLLDVIARHTDQPMAYTWRNDQSSFPPSRIDYHICSNSVMEVAKAFTLETETMPAGRLAEYGLEPFDTYLASDHFPKVTDFNLLLTTRASETAAGFFDIKISPNPTAGEFSVRLDNLENANAQCSLRRLDGSLVRQWRERPGPPTFKVDISDLPAGIYFLEIKTGEKTGQVKVVKI